MFSCIIRFLSLSTHLYQIKAPFRRNSVLLTRHHATPVVTLFFSRTHVTYVTSHYTVIIRYSTSVTYGKSCRASGHLVIYRECYGFQRTFFTLRRFFTLHSFTPSCFSRLPWGRQFNLKVRRVSCRSSKHSPGPTICLNHKNPQKINMWQVLLKG